MKNILVFGATTNPERYAYKAALLLQEKGYNFIPIGIKKGIVLEKSIINDRPKLEKVDTITMYVGAKNVSLEDIDYLIGLQPNRIIFNPGAENETLQKEAIENNIQVENACTLVLLRTDQF